MSDGRDDVAPTTPDEGGAPLEAAPAPAPTPVPEAADTIFRVLHVESVLYDLADPAPAVHLMEAEAPFRYLVIPLALSDAVALHHAWAGIEGLRPSTHELTARVLGLLRVEVIAARIVRLENGVFFAELDLMTPSGRQVVDARTSDAITLALRCGVAAPILCAEEVLASFYT